MAVIAVVGMAMAVRQRAAVEWGAALDDAGQGVRDGGEEAGGNSKLGGLAPRWLLMVVATHHKFKICRMIQNKRKNNWLEGLSEPNLWHILRYNHHCKERLNRFANIN